MALSKAALSAGIAEILKGADLKTTTERKIRIELEKKFDTDLTDRKEEIKALLMKRLAADKTSSDQSGDSEDEDDKASDDSDADVNHGKRARPNARGNQDSKRLKQENSSSGSEDEDEDGEDKNDEALARKIQKEELQSRTRAAKKSAKSTKAAKPAAKEPKKAAATSEPGKKKNNSGFTREYHLSEELAAVMGTPTMARHQVVKKIWAVVKERNLTDPADKRFTICDDALMNVFKIRRFRTFSMMKYLSKHFLEPS